MSDKKIIVITGPTASNKSMFADKILEKHDSIIINADSKQIYKEIPITTCQPMHKQNTKYKLYGHISINTKYSVILWINEITQIINKSIEKNIIPIIVGGTFMYIDALINGLFYHEAFNESEKEEFEQYCKTQTTEELFNQLCAIDKIASHKIHKNDKYRIKNAIFIKQKTGQSKYELNRLKAIDNDKKFIIYCTKPDREENYKKINQRTVEMIKNGAIEEVCSIHQTIINNGNTKKITEKIIGINEIMQYTKGEIDKKTMIEKIQQRTRNYSKTQYNWINNHIKNTIIIKNDQDIIL